MKKLLIPISLGCLSITAAVSAHSGKANIRNRNFPSRVWSENKTLASGRSLYNAIGLEQYGLSTVAFDYAWQGYQKLLQKGLIAKTQYLTICDFSQSSRNKRFYLIDVESQRLLVHTWVAHGRNSGGEYASHFSNEPESLQSSLGFYLTSATYNGDNGFSLRLQGLEPGYNSNALSRTIVLHGAAYVDGARARQGMMMGRSWGCPAVPKNESAKIINKIKSGSCLFIYHPSNNYLLHSKILND